MILFFGLFDLVLDCFVIYIGRFDIILEVMASISDDFDHIDIVFNQYVYQQFSHINNYISILFSCTFIL